MNKDLKKLGKLVLYALLAWFLYKVCEYIYNNYIVEGITNSPPVPYGVNLGGLYVLEDWFLSEQGPTGTTIVNTDPTKPDGVIKKFTQDNEPGNFFGECDLINKLNKLKDRNMSEDRNMSDEYIYSKFENHRKTYLNKGDIPGLFAEIKQNGINVVRLPVTWCIIYDNEYTIRGTNGRTTKISKRDKIVKDPYFEKGMYWAGIPIEDIENLLTIASTAGVQILIDFHTFPGGSSYGSYSGTWSKKTKFWDHNPTAVENMGTIIRNFCEWINNAEQEVQDGFYGLTPMNEPAHLSGIDAFYNQYPEDWEKDKNKRFEDITNVLQRSIAEFTNVGLHNKGKKLVMNVIETATIDFGYPEMFTKWKDWWKGLENTQTKGEQITASDKSTWAVLDVHHYEAWADMGDEAPAHHICNSDETDFDTCLDHIKTTNWKEVYGGIRNNFVDPNNLFYVTEFSNSLYNDTKTSFASGLVEGKGDYKVIRNEFYKKQLEALNQNNMKGFFWTWNVPKNSNYQSEWSLKTVLSDLNGNINDELDDELDHDESEDKPEDI